MLGVGWSEMLVIGVVALIVIGPKDLPVMMNRLGKFAGQIRRMGQEFQRELNKTTGLNEISNLRNSVTAPLRATADAIRKEFNTVTPSGTVEPSGALKPANPKVESVVDEIKAAAGMAPAPAAIPVVAEAAPAPAVKPVKKRAPRVKAIAPDVPVATAELPPVSAEAKPARKPRATKAAVTEPVKAAAPRAKKPVAAKKAETAEPKPRARAKKAE